MFSQYQLFVLENPSNNWDDVLQQEIFFKIAKLRLEGYRHEYGPTVMPLNTGDFYCTTLALFEKEADSFVPLATARICRYSVCKYYNITFPLLAITANGGNTLLHREVERIISEVDYNHKDISYDSSWTMTPKLRKTQLGTIVNLVFISQWINYHLDHSLDDFIVSATIKVKTDTFFNKLGGIPVVKNSLYSLKEVNNEDAVILRINEFSDFAMRLAKEYRYIWENRITIKSLEENIFAGEKISDIH